MLNMELNKTFTVAGIRWTVLEKLENGYLAIADSIGNKRFGSNNDWKESSIRKMLNTEFAEKIEKELGVELPEFERDLFSLDGLKEYGTCMDKVSLLSVDEYRKYRDKLPNTGKWWWTLTPDSTRCNGDSSWIRVVSSSGDIDNVNYYVDYGVRPVCIFPSSIFESEE